MEKKIMLVSKDCPVCESAKEMIKDEGEVELVDIDSEQGKKIAEAFNVKTVPFFVNTASIGDQDEQTG